MKAKTAALTMLIALVVMFLAVEAAWAKSLSQSIQLTVRVVGSLSLRLEDDWLKQNAGRPEAEVFSELKEHSIVVDKLVRENSTLWRFTKTE